MSKKSYHHDFKSYEYDFLINVSSEGSALIVLTTFNCIKTFSRILQKKNVIYIWPTFDSSYFILCDFDMSKMIRASCLEKDDYYLLLFQ